MNSYVDMLLVMLTPKRGKNILLLLIYIYIYMYTYIYTCSILKCDCFDSKKNDVMLLLLNGLFNIKH